MTEDAPVLGVSATAETPDREQLGTVIEAAGAVPCAVDSPAELPEDLAAIVTVGPSALRAIARRQPAVPVLPVGVDCGLPSVPRADLAAAVEAIVANDTTEQEAPMLEVAVDDEVYATAFREVTMITAEPARISEFAIEHERAGALDTVRADGVVIATPAGSYTYAAAGDGPLLEPGTGLAIVPVAPFRTDRDRWVVPHERVSVCVQRDEADVTVEADGAVLTTVGRDVEVSLTPAGKLGVLVVEESVRDPR
ncbi:NAD(+)/NADH kinase [Salinarchaeum laminariae]|uniref:NAD(+)/NADH kinase n=1 Tax=Salinarchaeum laminariae TaxID=869888 RepID=UPI0020BED7F9|nr:NAD(+)/NADH kinase [Salinarchaeum laminariae]